jgi:hypothetical protein
LVLSGLRQLKIGPAWIVTISCIVLTAIFWGNLLRFHPSQIDWVYDDGSEAAVIARLARAEADGVFKDTTLGSNIDPSVPRTLANRYELEVRYYEHPHLLHSPGVFWDPYPSHFALQGFVFVFIDYFNPFPHRMRIGFYHMLASLFTAGMLVWMAAILRTKFGWAAFFGFLVPAALEPMFSGMAPNLCWFVGSILLPLPFGMLIADEDDSHRRTRLFGLMFLAFVARFLCGYEFTSTIILATATGCLLSVKERSDQFRHILLLAARTVGVGFVAFTTATVLHAAKQGGFAVVMERAAARMVGDDGSLQVQLIYGKFQPIGAVVWAYLGGNDVTLIKSFGLFLTLIAGYAIILLLDERFNWFYGAGRRKLQVLALAVLASFAAPLSWFVLGKGHSFDHVPYDMLMWYVPTIPLGCAMLAVSSVSFIEYLSLKRGDALRSIAIASIPLLVVCSAIVIRVVDKKTETGGTWVIQEHADAAPIFEDASLGIEFRMSNQWFTLRYPCSIQRPEKTFVINAEQDGKTVGYDFDLIRNQVIASKDVCVDAQAKSDRPVTRISFVMASSRGPIWQRDETISLPNTFGPEPITNRDWDRGISRESGSELLVGDADFGRMLIKKGDELQISPTERRTIVSIASAGLSRVLTLDGAPIRLANGVQPIFGIVRK